MRHVERHILKEQHSFFNQIDWLCFFSKNLYNYAKHVIRQAFIFDSSCLGSKKNYSLGKDTQDYKVLLRKSSHKALIKLGKNWNSSLEANIADKMNPENLISKSQLPKFKIFLQRINLLTLHPLGKTRGLCSIFFKTKINADVNGSYNIMREVIPKVFDLGIEEVARCREYILQLWLPSSQLLPEKIPKGEYLLEGFTRCRLPWRFSSSN